MSLQRGAKSPKRVITAWETCYPNNRVSEDRWYRRKRKGVSRGSVVEIREREAVDEGREARVGWREAHATTRRRGKKSSG